MEGGVSREGNWNYCQTCTVPDKSHKLVFLAFPPVLLLQLSFYFFSSLLQLIAGLKKESMHVLYDLEKQKCHL